MIYAGVNLFTRILRYGRSISEAVFFLAAAGFKLNWRQRAAWWAYRRWGHRIRPDTPAGYGSR